MMTRRIIVVGSYLAAVSMRVPAFPIAGQTLIAMAVERGHGGKGSNQAIQTARYGGVVDLLSAVGLDEAGNHAARQWAVDGIDANAVERSATAATGIGFILVNCAGENQIVIDQGAVALCTAAFVARRVDSFQNAAVLLTQLEIPLDGAKAALRAGRRNHAVTILNPAPSTSVSLDQSWDDIDYLIPNEGEAQALAGLGSIKANGAALAKRVAAGVIITAGAAGAYIFQRNGDCWELPAPMVNVIDTTGAGDAFCGTFAASMAESGSLECAVRHGVAAGSLACTRSGVEPALHYRPQILDLAQTMHIRQVIL